MNENINEIEIAIRDGMIDELLESGNKLLETNEQLMEIVNSYNKQLDKLENQNHELLHVVKELVIQRDSARDLAIRLEAECHGCMDTVHHGNEEQY